MLMGQITQLTVKDETSQQGGILGPDAQVFPLTFIYALGIPVIIVTPVEDGFWLGLITMA